jgi:hypothetical protein
VTTLQQLQDTFGRGLRSSARLDRAGLQQLTSDGDPALFEERFEVYRNNAWQFFQAALERTYPVLRRRVGPDYFRQLAREYRDEYPSRRGDLHWVGADFPAWLAGRLDRTGYEWLTDLARLEWACEEAAVTSSAAPIELTALAQFSPDDLPALRLYWQDSLRIAWSFTGSTRSTLRYLACWRKARRWASRSTRPERTPTTLRACWPGPSAKAW